MRREDGSPSSSLVTLILGDAGRPDQQQQVLLHRNSSNLDSGSNTTAAAALSNSFSAAEGGGRQVHRQKSGSTLPTTYSDGSQEETSVLRDLIKKMWADQVNKFSNMVAAAIIVVAPLLPLCCGTDQ